MNIVLTRSLQRVFLLLLGGILSFNTAFAVVSLIGTVTDTSGVPLAGAHVTLSDNSNIVVTDWDGRFQILDLSVGSYDLTASHVGYQTVISHNVTLHEGSPTRIHLRLSFDILLLSPATVHSQQTNPHNNGQTFTITRKEWRLSGAETAGDVLRHLPGITLLEGDHRQRVSLRGSPPRTVRIELDGVPINNAGTGEAEVGHVDLDQLQAIEVTFSGLGGTVKLISNIVSRDSLFASLSTGYGSYNQIKTSGQLEHQYGDISLLGSVKHLSDRGDFKYRIENGDQHHRVNNHSTVTNAIQKLQWTGELLELDAGIYFDSYRRGVPGLIYSAPTPEADLKVKRISGRLSGGGSTRFIDIDVVGYLSDYVGRYQSPALQFDPTSEIWIHQLPEDSQQESFRYGITADVTPHMTWGTASLMYRLQYDEYSGKDLLRDRTTVGGVGLGLAQRTVQTLDLEGSKSIDIAEFHYRINPALSTQWIKDSGEEIYQLNSPSVNLSLSRASAYFTSHLTVGWGSSVSLPPFNSQFLVESLFAVGNKDIKPESGKSVNLALNLTSTNASDWQFGMVWYQRMIKDMIVWKRNFQGKYYPDNLLRARITGIETNGTVELIDNFISIRGNYTFQRPLNDTPNDINRGRVLSLTSQHSGSLEAMLSAQSARMTLRSRFVGRRYSSESNVDQLSTAGTGLPRYQVYDFHIVKDLFQWGLKLSTEISVNNLLNRSYRVIERSPMPGRNYFAQITITY